MSVSKKDRRLRLTLDMPVLFPNRNFRVIDILEHFGNNGLIRSKKTGKLYSGDLCPEDFWNNTDHYELVLQTKDGLTVL